MATLVLSTVGTVLGGPVGSAIGALIGQSIDQQILAAPSRGPRLGDLNVQRSSYGTQIPRIYGTMRVAGSVVWSTDLVESTQTTGAKGQPDVTYSYSVSFAVALSSRHIADIRRIWADGKLIRGDDGVFKIPTTFRFYDGSEDQIIDPLIGSIEGIDNTPAYRGVALAVFENLELAEFGNRIPFLTFEIVADAAAPSITDILEDASRGAITCDAEQPVIGYAAYGRSIKAAIEPLVDCFAVELFDDGSQVRGPRSSVVEIIEQDDLGSSANNELQPRTQREQSPVRAVPAVLRLSYYDPARDYQSGEARASASDRRGSEEQQELPAVIDAETAKALAQQLLARRWAARDRLTLRLPPRHANIEPGARIDLDLGPARWTVEKCTIDGLVTVLELRSSWTPGVVMHAVAANMATNSVVVDNEPSVALFDVPDVFGHSSDDPIMLLAASTAAAGWRRRVVRLTFADQGIDVRTATRKSVLGHALNALPPGEPYLIDALSSVDVQLVDPDQWLVSCDDEALAGGSNLAMLGSELIQFGDAAPLGEGRFRLARLLRGRGGTEWAASIHAEGEAFVLIEPESLQPIRLPPWAAGTSVEASIGPNARANVTMTLESLRPLTPVRIDATIESNGDLAVRWVRRSRKGLAWIDEVDAPLGETREEYRVTLIGLAGSLELSTTQSELTIAANALAEVGAGLATIDVRQVGDWAVSRPARVSISL